MIIRNATLEDLPAMKQLFADTIRSVCRADYSEEQTTVWASSANKEERWLDVVVNQFVLLAEIDGELVGFGTLKNDNYIDFFYVHKDFQGMGIGKELLQRLLQRAKDQREKLLTSDVSITAKPFFEKHGFKVVAQQENIRQDVTLINYKMIRHLPGPEMNPGLKGIVAIEHAFKITGRGLVFAGIIVEGDFWSDDYIEFRVGETLWKRKIRSREMIRSVEYNPLKYGLILQCENKEEVEALRLWKPFNAIACIYASDTNPA